MLLSWRIWLGKSLFFVSKTSKPSNPWLLFKSYCLILQIILGSPLPNTDRILLELNRVNKQNLQPSMPQRDDKGDNKQHGFWNHLLWVLLGDVCEAQSYPCFETIDTYIEETSQRNIVWSLWSWLIKNALW